MQLIKNKVQEIRIRNKLLAHQYRGYDARSVRIRDRRCAVLRLHSLELQSVFRVPGSDLRRTTTNTDTDRSKTALHADRDRIFQCRPVSLDSERCI